MPQVSTHCSYAEAIYSDTAKREGINNYFTSEQLARMKIVAEEVYERVVAYFGVQVYISSFFRNSVLNAFLGGSDTSQHVLGEAMDLDADFYGRITNKQIFDYVKDYLEFDQLIWEKGTDEEPSWVHVSFTTRRPNRKQILKTKTVDGQTKTVNYSV
jgi:zinc D-Ala-D-Ala carboxypeptidase